MKPDIMNLFWCILSSCIGAAILMTFAPFTFNEGYWLIVGLALGSSAYHFVWA